MYLNLYEVRVEEHIFHTAHIGGFDSTKSLYTDM